MVNNLKYYSFVAFSVLVNLVLTQSEKIGDILDSESRISAIKCNEYKSVVQEITHVPSVLGRPPIVKTKVNCPIKSVSLIIGGVAALPKEFPHMAVIGFEVENHTDWFCGGSLISEWYVLTAAHCIKDIPVNKIRLGVIELDTQDQNVTATDFGVSERIYHPEFRNGSHYNDIGLIRLDRSVEFNHYIRPACLPDGLNTELAKIVIAIGYGLTSKEGQPSDILLKVGLDILSQDECRKAYHQTDLTLKYGLIESQICAGSRVEDKNTCGPIVKARNDHECMYTILGVTSFGLRCGTRRMPSVYTKVAYYLSWIENIVWPTT